MLGAGLVLAELAERGRCCPAAVRLIFQPAEESARSGALAVIAAGEAADLERIFALHCDPRVDVGRVGLRSGRDHRRPPTSCWCGCTGRAGTPPART